MSIKIKNMSILTFIKVALLTIVDTIWVILKHFPNLEAAEDEAREYNKEETRKYAFHKSVSEGRRGNRRDGKLETWRKHVQKKQSVD